MKSSLIVLMLALFASCATAKPFNNPFCHKFSNDSGIEICDMQMKEYRAITVGNANWGRAEILPKAPAPKPSASPVAPVPQPTPSHVPALNVSPTADTNFSKVKATEAGKK